MLCVSSTYDEGRTTLGIAFICELVADCEIKLCDENLEARWFALDARLPELAFEHGAAAVRALTSYLRSASPDSR